MKRDGPIPPHDYLDDLESFFYVMGDVILSRVPVGMTMDPDVKELLEAWDSRNVTLAAGTKSTFTSLAFNPALVDRGYWGSACVNLFKGFHSMMRDVVVQKDAIRVQEISMEEKIAMYKAMGSNGRIEEHYDTLDNLFNMALQDLEKTDTEFTTRARSNGDSGATSSSQNTLVPTDSPSTSLLAPTEKTSSFSAQQPESSTRQGSKRGSRAFEDMEPVERPVKRRNPHRSARDRD